MAGIGAFLSLPAVPAKIPSRSDLPTFVIVYCQPVVCRVHDLRPGEPAEG
jgi:hypothetical protein